MRHFCPLIASWVARLNNRGALLILLFAALFYAMPADACSLFEILSEESSDFVLVGEVSGYVSGEFDGQLTNGLLIRPIHVFREPTSPSSREYELFGYRVGLSCAPRPSMWQNTLSSDYPVGTVVALTGSKLDAKFPGDISVASGHHFSKIEDPCSINELVSRKYGYEFYQDSCGDNLFEANKDISLLPSANDASRQEILGRLSRYEGALMYRSLVRKYIDDPDAYEHLIALRYSAILDMKCTDIDHIRGVGNRGLLSEYCRDAED